MSDVALARGLIIEIAGHCWAGKGDMLDRVYDAIVQRHPNWSRRRVRAFFHSEAALVKWHEMNELAEVAKIEAERRGAERQAKLEHAQFIERTAQLAETLSVLDAEFHREASEALRGVSSQGTYRQVRTGSITSPSVAERCSDQSGAMGSGAGR